MCAERRLLPIEIFTDGSSRGNPGPGGYGVILRCGEHYKELSEGFPETTNNRMELTAVIVGLEAVRRPNAEIILYSDSKYVVDSLRLGAQAVRETSQRRPVDALSGGVPPSPRPFRLGEGPCRQSDEQPL